MDTELVFKEELKKGFRFMFATGNFQLQSPRRDFSVEVEPVETYSKQEEKNFKYISVGFLSAGGQLLQIKADFPALSASRHRWRYDKFYHQDHYSLGIWYAHSKHQNFLNLDFGEQLCIFAERTAIVDHNWFQPWLDFLKTEKRFRKNGVFLAMMVHQIYP